MLHRAKSAVDPPDEMMRPARLMSLTPELVSLCERPEPDLGFPTRWTLLTDADFTEEAQKIEERLKGNPLWLFAYGSLIWNPVFDTVEKRTGTAFGWHRSFCLELKSFRGTPEAPGLMMALDRGGRCDGVVYRIADADRTGQIERLLRREIIAVENLGSMRWLPVRTAQGEVEALSFWVGPSGEHVSLKLPLDTVAHRLARACGHMGSCAAYLYNTVSHLEEHGIRDRNLWRLQEMVAAEVRKLHGVAG